MFWHKDKEPKPAPWKCAECGKREEGGFIPRGPSRTKPSVCNWCTDWHARRDEKRRKRQEELAALVAGRLAPQMPGFRDEKGDFSLTAEEAMRIAKAIMDLPGSGKVYD